ncbi:MAG: biotin--[acetyl-CoA-carboxylase] ligase [Crocinitomicaceae bacterium]|nr:biotin--[acetyl-CoA-carboxylase] ligase [Crocinitomicaceae bacterium]
MVFKRLERNLIQLDSVDSTNDHAAHLVRSSSVSSGTIVIAREQYSGRGQRSNVWTTEAGKNLTCSIILFPTISAKHSFYLNIIVSLAVRKTLEDLKIQAKIKWPNDILVNGKKIAGILVDNQLQGDKIAVSIAGLGLNVNQKHFEGLTEATSVINELSREIELMDVFDQFYSYLDFYYNLLLESNFELLKKHYYNHLYLINEEHDFEDSNGQFTGKIIGIDENGFLQIQTESGKRSFDIKEVKYL